MRRIPLVSVLSLAVSLAACATTGASPPPAAAPGASAEITTQLPRNVRPSITVAQATTISAITAPQCRRLPSIKVGIVATGSNSDSILVLNPQTSQWVTMRVPYPLGFYARGLDARLDDPSAPAGFAGWKSRAVYSNYGTHFVWHIEGGKGTKGKEVKFQVRPDPLAR